eukprot:26706-Chlamydomonas_euryale.AAC.1
MLLPMQDYPEGPGVLLELLQNADDAGASELSLMLDTTSYPADSTLGPGMAGWQGPALLAQNDAVFSPSDFANIARIGQDTKAARPTSTGRFGLGFNATYHLTDLPSFVSGDHLVCCESRGGGAGGCGGSVGQGFCQNIWGPGRPGGGGGGWREGARQGGIGRWGRGGGRGIRAGRDSEGVKRGGQGPRWEKGARERVR